MKPSERAEARAAAARERRAERLRRIYRIVAWLAGTIVGLAGVVAAIPIVVDWLTKAPTATIVIPRHPNDPIVPARMVVLDNRLDQRLFYLIDKTQVDTGSRLLVGLPFSIINQGEKRLQKVTITFVFERTTKGLNFDTQRFASSFFPPLDMDAQDFDGRQTLRRSYAIAPDRAAVSYNFEEILPQQESQFEFHFSPDLYEIGLSVGGGRLPMAVYDVKVNVVSDILMESQFLRVFVMPATSKEEFLTGVDLLSLYYAAIESNDANWCIKLLRRIPVVGNRLERERENVIVLAPPRQASAKNQSFNVIRPGSDVVVRRFKYVQSTDERK